MKKSFALFMAVCLMFALLAGCSSGESTSTDEESDDNNKSVTLEYFAFSPSGGHEKDLEKMIKAFEEKYPNINIDYELASFENYFTKLQTQIAGGNAPDTFELNYENFVSYASKGVLLNLSPIIKETGFKADNLNQKAYEAYQYKGKQFGMVESFSNVVLFYNKDLFDKNNVEYPQADWTWEDELKAAKKLTHEDQGVWGTFAPIQFHEFYKTIAQNGGSIFNEDMTKVTINSPQNVETLQWMVDKIHKYNVTPSAKEMSGQKNADLFKAGKIAMLRTGIWMFSAFKDVPFEWEIALEPGNTQKAHHFFANGLAVSKDTEHPEAAWKWVSFMSASEEAAKIRINNSWELPAVQNKELVQKYLEQTPPESREVVFKALDSLVVPPVIEEQAKMMDIIGKELEKAKLQQISPEQALKNAEEKLKALIN